MRQAYFSDGVLKDHVSASGRALALKKQAEVLKESSGTDAAAHAAALVVARDYVQAFAKVGGSSSVLMLPGNTGPGDVTNMIASAMGIYKSMTTSPKR